MGGAPIGEQVAMAPLSDPDERYWQLYYRKYPLSVSDPWYDVWVPEREAEKVLKRHPVEEDWCW